MGGISGVPVVNAKNDVGDGIVIVTFSPETEKSKHVAQGAGSRVICVSA